jgi:tetratricopeptide (TPR) repeat protein
VGVIWDGADRRRALQVRSELGLALSGLSRDAEAVEAFGRAAELEPDNGAHAHNIGAALCDLGRYEKAVEAFERSLDVGPPEDGDTLSALCDTLEFLGRDDEAREARARVWKRSRPRTGTNARGS